MKNLGFEFKTFAWTVIAVAVGVVLVNKVINPYVFKATATV